MRRFELAYKRNGLASIVIEGVQFSSGVVVLELYPDDDWHGTREFRNLQSMEYVINEFGDTAMQWLDAENEGETLDLVMPPLSTRKVTLNITRMGRGKPTDFYLEDCEVQS